MTRIISILCSLDSLFYKFLNRFDASYTKRILYEAWLLFKQLWPYLALGILLSTLIKLFLSKQWIANFFRKNQNTNIVISSLLGVFSPLGSYIVIPLSAALFQLGVPIQVLMAFLVASPLINPSLFFLTAGAFGYKMALMRIITAFLLGISAGYITRWATYKKITVVNNIRKNNLFQFSKVENPDTFRQWLTAFFRELYKMTRYISKFFFLALLLSALIKIMVSPNMIVRIFSPDSLLSVVISTGAGVPFYVCGGAAIPVVQQLAELGLQKGAVLAFFISGPITKISNLILMQTVFNIKFFLIYLFTGLFGAIIFGIIYNLF